MPTHFLEKARHLQIVRKIVTCKAPDLKNPWFFSSISFKCHLRSKSSISDEAGVRYIQGPFLEDIFQLYVLDKKKINILKFLYCFLVVYDDNIISKAYLLLCFLSSLIKKKKNCSPVTWDFWPDFFKEKPKHTGSHFSHWF